MENNEIEIPFGAKDSELVEATYYIPDGMEAIIEGDKVIIRKKESEDEKTRKEIISLVLKVMGREKDNLNDENYDKMLDWLEKQGEQKVPVLDFKAKDWYVSKVDGKIHNIYYSVDKPEPKFKVGDWITDGEIVFHIASYHNDYGYQVETTEGISFYLSDKRVENKYHLWTIEDAKDGDILAGSKGEVILMFRGIGNTEWADVIDYHCYYDYYRKVFIVQKDLEHWGNISDNQLKPATKEQCDFLFSKMKEAGYEWDAEKKELKLLITNGGDFESENCEQNSAKWSDEDEYMLNETIQHLEELIRIDKAKHLGCDVQYYQRDIDWLKSLKERIQSKQEWSEEDERIRKVLIEYLTTKDDNAYYVICGVSTKKIIAWLEKQGNDSYLQEKIENFTNAHKGEDPDDIITACRDGEKKKELKKTAIHK